MRLTAITPYGATGASSRVRVFEWLHHLGESANVSCYLGGANNQPRTLAKAPASVLVAELRLRLLVGGSMDTLMLHREASPLSSGRLEAALLKQAKLGVYDFDDALQWDVGAGGLARRLVPKSRKCHLAAATADRVIAGNAVLADWASTIARDVVIIPTCVEPALYDLPEDYTVHDPPRIGWIGSPSTEPHLALIAPALLRLHQRTGARLTVVSSGDQPLGTLEVMVDRVRWTAECFTAQLRSFDVAIAPLIDSPYARGKCAYKVLQYGAAGIPTVGSPVGANANALATLGQAEANGLQEWDTHLDLVLQAATETRADLGRAARSGVERCYSFSRWEGEMRRALALSARPGHQPPVPSTPVGCPSSSSRNRLQRELVAIPEDDSLKEK